LFFFLDLVNKNFIKGVSQTTKLSGVEQQIRWTTFTLSLAGLPPLLGFSAKWLALSEIIQFRGWLVFVLALLFSFSLFYYTQIFILTLLSRAKPSKQKERFRN